MIRPLKIIALSIPTVLLLSFQASCGEPISRISARNADLLLYDTLVVEIELSYLFSDPYDSREVELNAVITGPDGNKAVIPGFYTGCGKKWEVRYTPLRPGEYSYRISVESVKGSQDSRQYRFEVSPSARNGFLRIAKNRRYLVFDSGRPFFGLGHNVCWTATNMAWEFDEYFRKLSVNGCNMTRLWLNNEWSLKVECGSPGKYDAVDSVRIDGVLESARENGIYIILTMDSYSSLMEEKGNWGEESWAKSVYNRNNGGPCERPWDFFTDSRAKHLYKKRLRYIISRWGYSPNILAFEFWNELDAPKEWIEEMARYLKSINPHGQIITTSLGYPWANNFDETSIWSLKELDIIDRHIYGNMSSDITGYIISTNKALSDMCAKPILIGEFGMNSGRNDTESDPSGRGIDLHNSLWCSAMSGSFGGAMAWWWDTYLRKHDLYFNYKALKEFVNGVDWGSDSVSYARTSPVTLNGEGAGEAGYSEVVISAKEAWGDTSYAEFTVENNGDVSGGVLNHYLQGEAWNKVRIEPVFNVDYPADGEFIIHVGSVSQGARLVVNVDGKDVLSKEFLAGSGDGPWMKSSFRKDLKAYQCYYGTAEKIWLAKGKHTIRISNTGKDWLGIKRIVLTNYKGGRTANARIAGMAVGRDILLWIQNKDYDHGNMMRSKTEPVPIENAFFYLYDIRAGKYNIAWYDTSSADIISTASAEASDGALKIDIPVFSEDIACRIKKM